MPFRSKTQMRKFFADPELRPHARRWLKHTRDAGALPERVEKRASLSQTLGFLIRHVGVPALLGGTGSLLGGAGSLISSLAKMPREQRLEALRSGKDILLEVGLVGGELAGDVARAAKQEALKYVNARFPGGLLGAKVAGGAALALLGGLAARKAWKAFRRPPAVPQPAAAEIPAVPPATPGSPPVGVDPGGLSRLGGQASGLLRLRGMTPRGNAVLGGSLLAAGGLGAAGLGVLAGRLTAPHVEKEAAVIDTLMQNKVPIGAAAAALGTLIAAWKGRRAVGRLLGYGREAARGPGHLAMNVAGDALDDVGGRIGGAVGWTPQSRTGRQWLAGAAGAAGLGLAGGVAGFGFGLGRRLSGDGDRDRPKYASLAKEAFGFPLSQSSSSSLRPGIRTRRPASGTTQRSPPVRPGSPTRRSGIGVAASTPCGPNANPSSADVPSSRRRRIRSKQPAGISGGIRPKRRRC